ELQDLPRVAPERGARERSAGPGDDQLALGRDPVDEDPGGQHRRIEDQRAATHRAPVLGELNRGHPYTPLSTRNPILRPPDKERNRWQPPPPPTTRSQTSTSPITGARRSPSPRSRCPA